MDINFSQNNGHLSSAAFKDKNGLSVDRTDTRDLLSSALEMRKRKMKSHIFSVSVESCFKVNAYLVYKPSKENINHSEIHSSKYVIKLSDYQAYQLSREASVVLKHDEYIA